jgi:hypothetical protein
MSEGSVSVDVDPFADESRIEDLEKSNARLQAQLRKAKDKTDLLVNATMTAAYDAMVSMGPLKLVPRPAKDSRRKNPEVALLDMGDWQGAKLTTTYNSTVMAERVLRYMDKVRTMTHIAQADHPVKTATIVFGGDMVEGLFNFPTQAFEIDQTIFGQFTTVTRLLVDVVRYALSLFDEVQVIGEWGNHGRIGSKRDNVPRADNVDRMCYEMARQLLRGESRVQWEDCPEDIQRLEIGGYRALVIHGDEIGRNGYASPTTIAAWVVRQKSGAYPWAFQDAYVHHYHNHSETALPDGRGALFITGSTESDNRYAGVTMAASAVPSQRLHYVDPVAGRLTAQYKVWLA